jgi:hypothetical protein
VPPLGWLRWLHRDKFRERLAICGSVGLVAESDPNQQASKAVEKITGSEPVRGEDLVSNEDLKRKFREAKKRLEGTADGAKRPAS